MNPAIALSNQQHTRPSSVIRQQLTEFLATLPNDLHGPPPDDFAALLEWESWQRHVRELNTELFAAIACEAEDSSR